MTGSATFRGRKDEINIVGELVRDLCRGTDGTRARMNGKAILRRRHREMKRGNFREGSRFCTFKLKGRFVEYFEHQTNQYYAKTSVLEP